MIMLLSVCKLEQVAANLRAQILAVPVWPRSQETGKIGVPVTAKLQGLLVESLSDDNVRFSRCLNMSLLKKYLAAPLNLANSPSLHLLTPPEQALCSQLRILPKPYLVIKETLVREYARRGGKLRRREARDLVKIDVNKTSRVWDFLVQAGYLKITTDPTPAPPLHEAS